ncbi:MAG: class I SAM-dependent methyltransferase [Pseudomonadota bacterium]|nr:class I SAM-dependent methyltransferase [Pseudomonadota bacterium]
MSFYEDHIFPYALDIALSGIQQARKDLLASATGRVLEVGIGNGANLPHYSSSAEEVVGIEPCAAMVGMAQNKIERLHAKSELSLKPEQYKLEVGSGEDLPYEDDSFDCAVACLVFCTIPNAEKAAQEMFRVLKPGGKVLFLEHVHAKPGFKRRMQNWFNPIWKPLACGCNLNRDTKSLFAETGFVYEAVDEFHHHPRMLPLLSSVIRGVAAKPAAI